MCQQWQRGKAFCTKHSTFQICAPDQQAGSSPHVVWAFSVCFPKGNPC